MSKHLEPQPPSDDFDRQLAGAIASRLDPQRGRARAGFLSAVTGERPADAMSIRPAVVRRASVSRWFIGGSVGALAAAALAVAVMGPGMTQTDRPVAPVNRATLPQVQHTIAWDTHEAPPVIVNDRSTARSFERQRVDRFRWYDASLEAHIEVTVPSREVMLANWPTH